MKNDDKVALTWKAYYLRCMLRFAYKRTPAASDKEIRGLQTDLARTHDKLYALEKEQRK